MKVLVVHPGTQHSFALARQVERLGCLSRFWTGFAYMPESILGRSMDRLPALHRKVMGRSLSGLMAGKLRTRPLIDLRALRRLRAGDDEQTVMFERNLAFQKSIPQEEIVNSDVVIGADTASWLLAERAAALGRYFILDRTIGHPLAFEQLAPVLQSRFPDWIEECPQRLSQLNLAEQVEHRLAHRITVGSSFTRRTLVERGVPPEKIIITPLGIDLGTFHAEPRSDDSRPIRFVFVGSLSARKGVPLLLEVWRSLGKVSAELWLAGSPSDRIAKLIPALPGLRVLGRVSRRELPGLLRQCDVLVFPSYFEGFGAVLLEALATGLPIIATDATGAPDVITEGVEGHVIPTGSAEALRAAMQRFIKSPGDLAPLSQAARRCAERYSWNAYGDHWMDILRQIDHAFVGQGLSDQAPSSSLLATAGVIEAKRMGTHYHPVKALLAHPGTQYSFRLAGQLQQRGCLRRFWTGIAYVPGSPLGRCIQFLPVSVQRQLANRRLESVPAGHLRSRPSVEWRALRRLHAGHEQQIVMLQRNAAFQRLIPDRELAKSTVVIGFDTSSWLLAERSKTLGRTFILDRSIGHPLSFQRLLPGLLNQFPEWAEDLPPRIPELLIAEEIEHQHAERIVVPSSFTRGTLIEHGVPADKIVVIPFGVDLNTFRPARGSSASRPLRFVFVGSMGARKGVPLLLDAWRSLAHDTAELWLVGPVSERIARLIPALPRLRIVGKVPGREMPALLRQCDVLVFPSYFEGLAQVQLEAMASGLAIISTEASGASDLITNGQEGFVIPSGDAEALQDAMRQFITSSADLAMMSRAARSTAERFSWDTYGNHWIDLLHRVV